ncbi:hypothetical protein LEP1GSC110_4876 [Leptospira interrogans serovar Medanensis str. UT053]|nr:hypothetical protein LEP1GSC110_4876 [Leptospira interrogans serovar Medanensis str. UT053]
MTFVFYLKFQNVSRSRTQIITSKEKRSFYILKNECPTSFKNNPKFVVRKFEENGGKNMRF